MIAVTERTSTALREFLREEGYLVEAAASPDGYGAHLDIPSRSWDEIDLLSALEREPGPLVRIGRWPRGTQSALAVTGDIDSVTLTDFSYRLWEAH